MLFSWHENYTYHPRALEPEARRSQVSCQSGLSQKQGQTNGTKTNSFKTCFHKTMDIDCEVDTFLTYLSNRMMYSSYNNIKIPTDHGTSKSSI